jgi:hypothetical protein
MCDDDGSIPMVHVHGWRTEYPVGWDTPATKIKKQQRFLAKIHPYVCTSFRGYCFWRVHEDRFRN